LIQNTLPTAPTLILPADNSTTTNRTLSLTWNNSDDIDSDTLTYNIIIDDNPTFNNPEVNVSNISQTNSVNTTYNLETELDVDTTYYWKVSAKDGSGYGPYSTARNFTVQSYLSFTLLTSTIEFGTLSIGNSTDTTDNSPSPIWGENNGNIVFNIIVNATQYFTQAALNTSNYQFKFRENETGSFNLTLSALNFTNMLATSSTVSLVDLDWREINDDFLMDLNLTVPLDESPGVKSSTITFTIEG
ncbi:MAG: fibronectin type III domain-containing protein, partial [Nanoarchaeota archaeon]|nr:fibronectin type III domain-containing protein [Nanoarchaeota archaeon]MBU1643691.1 fibronectin type III domain-containing protein [Nanoarchaeota archaeon]